LRKSLVWRQLLIGIFEPAARRHKVSLRSRHGKLARNQFAENRAARILGRKDTGIEKIDPRSENPVADRSNWFWHSGLPRLK
jgi:hypothetical protein